MCRRSVKVFIVREIMQVSTWRWWLASRDPPRHSLHFPRDWFLFWPLTWLYRRGTRSSGSHCSPCLVWRASWFRMRRAFPRPWFSGCSRRGCWCIWPIHRKINSAVIYSCHLSRHFAGRNPRECKRSPLQTRIEFREKRRISLGGLNLDI